MSTNRKGFYITTPIFYPNGNLHMGHAYTSTICDIMARYHRMVGDDTYFLSGVDEHTEKAVRAAEAAGKEPMVYLDEISENFQNLYSKLCISNDQYIRTTDKEVHWPGAIAMWNALAEQGDIYKGSYKGLYCVGSESFVLEKELDENGNCPDHAVPPEIVEEENYFFKLSKYAPIVREKIANDEIRVYPESRKKEILSFIDAGVKDVSFSRPKEKVSLGIPVPGDDSQVIYVWCDALTNYITALGYGREDTRRFEIFWPADYHVIGKDILRFHAVFWPAMLLSAKLPLPKNILVHGMITSGGRKMSKSIGNVIDPIDLINEYGSEAIRYYLAREISPFEDGDITVEKFKEVYNANLANGIGNLTARIMKMAEKYLDQPENMTPAPIPEQYHTEMQSFHIKRATDVAWKYISELDGYIQETQPFKLIKIDPEGGKEIIKELVHRLAAIAVMLMPILPVSSRVIQDSIRTNTMPETLFPRKD